MIDIIDTLFVAVIVGAFMAALTAMEALYMLAEFATKKYFRRINHDNSLDGEKRQSRAS